MPAATAKQRAKKTEWPHIILNKDGVPCIDGSRHKVYLIVLDYLDYVDAGMSVDQIHEDYPDLSRVEIHAALAYYYNHQAEVDRYIEDGEKKVEEYRRTHPNKFTRQQLLDRLAARGLAVTPSEPTIGA